MNALLYGLGRALLAVIQALPLTLVARLGRLGGAVAYLVDARHRRVALENLRRVFGDTLDPAARRRLARENFRRIGENFACGVKTAFLSDDALSACLEVGGQEHLGPASPGSAGPGCVVAIGHFGNFELYARCGRYWPGYRYATTYRALRQPALNRLFQTLRARSGCLFFERRSEAGALRAALSQSRLMLGLLVDQHAGDHGLRVPFFGADCSTSTAPALLALRYQCALHVGICYRTRLAHWRIELGPAIPTRQNGHARPLADIAGDINRAFEAAIRRDPANWFWVHRRWKPAPRAKPAAPIAAAPPPAA